MKALDLFNLDGQVAIVTGGGRGLGEQFAWGLAEAGAEVVLCSRKINNCQEVADKIKEAGGRATAFSCDVSQENEVIQMVEKVKEKYGKVDILINNSGATWGSPIEQMTVEQWQKVQNVNSLGTFLCCREVGKIMKEQKKGKIINVSSIAGLVGMHPQFMEAAGYHASKGAIIAFSKDLAAKWGAFNINVNVLAPGFFPTDIGKVIYEQAMKNGTMGYVPLNRLGSEEDLKGVGVFLASKASDYITGAVIIVDGGVTAV